jgi:hypothetical protein
VDELSHHHEEELILRKASVRVRPRGGFASYAETIRNTKYAHQGLTASGRELRIFYHGGARRGEAFENNRQDRVVDLLGNRFLRSPKTINQYLNYGRFLNEDTLNFFVDTAVSRDFFEAAQIRKREKEKILRSQGISDDDITAQISGDMMRWFQEFSATGKIEPTWNTPETEETRENNNRTEVPQQVPPSETRQVEFHPWEGNPPADGDDSPEKVKQDFEDWMKRLRDVDEPRRFCGTLAREASHLQHIVLRATAFVNDPLTTDDSREEGMEWAD